MYLTGIREGSCLAICHRALCASFLLCFCRLLVGVHGCAIHVLKVGRVKHPGALAGFVAEAKHLVFAIGAEEELAVEAVRLCGDDEEKVCRLSAICLRLRNSTRLVSCMCVMGDGELHILDDEIPQGTHSSARIRAKPSGMSKAKLCQASHSLKVLTFRTPGRCDPTLLVHTPPRLCRSPQIP